ncbi:hypothetical protein OG883_41210 [Streptomyces sp. NBC_01142]|nr:hypothetical protein [Streptomyces sp. NBC_01142]MCX4826091.1 hypothetical protein [Streptomyces sp. NBC_01142]
MPRTRLTRRERLALAAAALGAVVSDAIRALIAWLLNQILG